MSLRRIVGFVAFGSAFSVALYVIGCGSSGGAGTGGSSGSSGTTGSSGTKGTGSAGTKGTGSKGTGAAGTSGSGPEDAGNCPASVAAYTPMTFTAATAHQGECSPTDVSAFTTACGDMGSNSACEAWFTANVKGDGGAGTACGNCIAAPDNNGGAWLDPFGVPYPNYGACIALQDPTNGPTCAGAFNAFQGCLGFACDLCMSTAEGNACVTTEEGTGGGCASYLSTGQTDCKSDFADGGAFNTCSPGAASMTENPDYTYIITLICGSAG
jgi:hypothetical protein